MDFEQAKVWLYRVQQRLAITRSEATALLALAVLLAAGMALRYVQGQPRGVPSSSFAATDHRFQQGAARLRAGQEEGKLPSDAREAPRPLAAGDTASINLNAALPGELERLPGVGPVIAGRIAAYRRAHGPFAEVGHLQRVSGIGPKTMEDVAPLLVARSPTDTSRTGTDSLDALPPS